MRHTAQVVVKLESEVKVSQRYETLFYGLRRNHPHNATVLYPLAFLLRRIAFAVIVLFCISIPMIGAYLLCWFCIATLAYVIVE